MRRRLVQSLGAILGGAIPPLVATWLVASYGSWAVGVYLSAASLVSVGCLALITETSGADLDRSEVSAGESRPVTLGSSY